MRIHIYFSLLLLFVSCKLKTQDITVNNVLIVKEKKQCDKISGIFLPLGYSRLPVKEGSFGESLRTVALKKDKRVYLYNGSLKADQSVQFAVIDIPVGDKDLQQCADAVMRLRAEYFFSQKNYDSIHFKATDGTEMNFAKWRNGLRYKLAGNKLKPIFTNNISAGWHEDFENYLETVFSYAGTCSLAAELKPVNDINDIQPGDVFVKPGSPGHAMIVVDVCVNNAGKRMFMLAQGYMPAQDIHIVKNYYNDEISPWYEISASGQVLTPEWTFDYNLLKRWR